MSRRSTGKYSLVKMADNATESMPDNFNLLELIGEYIKETETDTLDLQCEGLGIPEVKHILNALRDSQVSELILAFNDLTNGMTEIAPLLIATKIRKLNISHCSLSKKDVLYLAEVLEHTQITDLDDSQGSWENAFSLDEGLKYVSHLKRSKVTTLASTFFKFFKSVPPFATCTSFLQVFLSSSITSLDLTRSKLSTNEFSFLCASLGGSSVTDLNLEHAIASRKELIVLSQKLADTKIEKLNLNRNSLKDDDLDILMTGILNSKVTNLDLQYNCFSNLRPIFMRLKETKIRSLNLYENPKLEDETFAYLDSLRFSSLASLNLAECELDDYAGGILMENLRFSSVTKLNIGGNSMGTLTIEKFAENVKDINLTDLNLRGHQLMQDEFITLGNCLKESRLTHIRLAQGWLMLSDLTVLDVLTFLKKTEGSSLNHIEMIDLSLGPNLHLHQNLDQISAVIDAKILVNTKFTELHLSTNEINDNVSILIPYLKYSSITHLNLFNNQIGDNGAAALAECLKAAPIRRLNLDSNKITSRGAKALALVLKDSHLLYLHLSDNKIKNDGLEFLAEHAKNSFISVLDIGNNPGKNVRLVEKVLWQNKTSNQKLVNTFKRIASKTVNDELCFDQSFDSSDVSTSLEKWMLFYKSLVVDSRAINVLLEEKSISFSKEEILKIMSDKFALQFSEFIACKIEADLEQQIDILKKAEEMTLTAIVKDLLYNREVYMLDQDKNILHPYVYKLLRKYNQPICSSVEPRGVEKIIEYFTEHTHIEGAEDVVDLLRGANIS